jgi:hypothetical protein
MTDTDLSKFGIRDVEQKHVVVCRPVGGGPMFTLLWRTAGKRGKPLPQIGAALSRAGVTLRVTEIRPPGTLDLDAVSGRVLVVKEDTP